jgi:hypothetical protein
MLRGSENKPKKIKAHREGSVGSFGLNEAGSPLKRPLLVTVKRADKSIWTRTNIAVDLRFVVTGNNRHPIHF